MWQVVIGTTSFLDRFTTNIIFMSTDQYMPLQQFLKWLWILLCL